MDITISVTLNIPDGMESAVNDTAHFAIVALGERMQTKLDFWHSMANQLQVLVPANERPAEVQKTIDTLRQQAKRERAATEIVQFALGEITRASNLADSEYRRRRVVVEP